MPRAEIASKQTVYTLGLLHAELAGKLLANKREASRSALPQDLRLDPEQVGLDRGSPPQSPQQRCQTERQLPLDGGSGVVVDNDGRLEPAVVVDVLDDFDHGFGAQPVPDFHFAATGVCLLRYSDRCF